MVKKLDIKKAITRIPTVLFLTSVTHVALADGFYTIIGPDGFPMVVPQGIHEKPPAKKKVVEAVEQVQPIPTQSKVTEQALPKVVEQTNNALYINAEKSVNTESVSQMKVEHTKISKKENPSTKQSAQTVPEKITPKAVRSKVIDHVQTQDQPKENVTISKTPQNVLSQPESPNPHETAVTTTVESQKSEQTNSVAQNNTTDDQHFSEIDGVKYVNNEFLEDKEFNLEGRKRFYITPDSNVAGVGHVSTFEQQRGVSKAVLEKFMHPENNDEKPVVVALSSNYYRLPKDQVEKSLAQSCFSGKKFKKPKELSQKNTQLGLWPVPPLKERFVYEIVKLNPDVEDIQITSYATTSKKPTFYWPLAVFLDQNGCVVEGVSGFKNKETDETPTQHASLEGVLKKPMQARYLFLTPLSEAIEVENKQLSNQGQIKLSVLR